MTLRQCTVLFEMYVRRCASELGFEDAESISHSLFMSGMCSATFKCRMLLQNWIVSNPDIALGGQYPGGVDWFNYLYVTEC